MKQKKSKKHTKSPQRPKAESSRDWKFDTLKQCAAITGTPVSVLKAAKAAGCPAFKLGSRVDFLEFMQWHWSNEEVVVLDNGREQALLAKSKREAQEMENAEKRKEIHLRTNLEELLWENGLGKFRADYFAILKKYRQQPTATMAEQIMADDLPRLMSSLNAALPSKVEGLKG